MALQTLGNNDFRGYLNYLGQNGDTNASNALSYTGNDGQVDPNAFPNFYSGAGNDPASEQSAMTAGKAYVQNAWNTWNNAPLGDSTGSYGGSSFTPDYASVSNANDLINQSNNLLGRLGNQQTIGEQNISDTFGNYRAGLQNGYNRNEADYNQNRTQSTRDNELAKNNIDRNVATRAQSLQRVIGSRGGGNSQAGLELAPYAAARTGTQQRNDVNQKYASNMSGLDQSFGRYKEDYGNSLTSLDDQKQQSMNSLRSNILQQEAQARGQLAQGQSALNYANTGNTASSQAIYNNAQPGLLALLQQIDQLGRQQITPTVRDATYSAPQLQNYTTSNAQNIQGVDPVLQDSISPMYQYLLKKDENNLGY